MNEGNDIFAEQPDAVTPEDRMQMLRALSDHRKPVQPRRPEEQTEYDSGPF